MDYEHDSMRDMKRVRHFIAKFLRNRPLVKVNMEQENGKNSGTILMVYSDTGEVTVGCVKGPIHSKLNCVV
jgi:hypothetical protein